MKYPLQVHVLKVFEGRFPVMETFGGRTYLEEASLGTFEIHTYSLLFLPSLLLVYHGGLCHTLTLPPCSALTGPRINRINHSGPEDPQSQVKINCSRSGVLSGVTKFLCMLCM